METCHLRGTFLEFDLLRSDEVKFDIHLLRNLELKMVKDGEIDGESDDVFDERSGRLITNRLKMS